MKGSKNVYELLNHMDIDLEDYDREVLNDMEKRSLKNNFRKSIKRKINFKKLGNIAAVAVLTLGFLAKQISKKCLCSCGVKGFRDFLFYRGSSGH